MRLLNLLFALAMLGFAAVQFNDPDAALWVVYYLVPAGWSLTAAVDVRRLQRAWVRRWLWVSAAVWFALVLYYWPPMPDFWRWSVQMEHESAREGVGLMIAWLSVLIAAYSARTRAAPEQRA